MAESETLAPIGTVTPVVPERTITIRKGRTVALAGNPNSGKTSLFNALTGSHQRVGNWPGVTVERKEGFRSADGDRVRVVDLPGTYSLTAHSPDERIARDFILHGDSDAVIAVVDAANIERNLYLVMQLIEIGKPLVVALNMSDIAESQGISIDAERLSRLLGVPAIPTCAHVGRGVDELWQATLKAMDAASPPRAVSYGRQVDEAIAQVMGAITEVPELTASHPPVWLAISLLLGDHSHLPETREADPRIQQVLSVVRSAARHLQDVTGDTAEAAIINGRYGAIAGIVREAVVAPTDAGDTRSDRVDRVLLHRVWGVPILLLAVAATFHLTFTVGRFPSEWIDAGSSQIGRWVAAALPDGMVRSLIVDGIIGGVGGVLVFLPQIFILFAVIAVLEDSGYMARAAFLMDRTMHRMRLHGKAFIPMVMGFGCNVPAIMATRTLESHRDRLVAIMVAPLMTCSARLPVYALIAGALFGTYAGLAIASMYALGVLLAAVIARLFRRHVLPGEEDPFVMELPPYHRPTLRGVAIHTWERGKLFLQKAGTVILAGAVIMWFLSAFPWGVEAGGADSYAGRLGRLAAPVIRPLGFGPNEGVALISGFVAKEIVVSTIGVLYGLGPEADRAALGRAIAAGSLTPLAGYAFMAFVLIYSPCLATIAAIKRETGSWKWAIGAMTYLTVLAWLVAFVIYQGGRLMGLG
jgi:ferrous iron transport protein B